MRQLLNLLKGFIIVRLCGTFHLWSIKIVGGAGGQTGFPPNLSISPPLSVSSLLFFCFTVLRELHCTKSTMLQITVCCDLTRV